MVDLMYCGGELVTGVEDIPCEHCGCMEYPCPCEISAEEKKMNSFVVGRWYTVGYEGKLWSGECILKTNSCITLRHPLLGVNKVYILDRISVVLP